MATNSASSMTDSAIKIKLKEAEEDLKKQMEMLASRAVYHRLLQCLVCMVQRRPLVNYGCSKSDGSVPVDISESSRRTKKERWLL